MTDNIGTDLNAVIASAVNARIEAQVAAAFASDDLLASYVSAALQQTVEVPKRGSSYDKIKIPYVKHVLDTAIQEATKTALQRVVADEISAIEAAVRKELKASINTIASQLVDSVAKAAESPYGITVEMKYPGR